MRGRETLRIRRPSCFGVEPERPVPRPGTRDVDFQELKRWVVDGSVVRHLLRYRQAELVTHRVDHVSKPFLIALVMRTLSRRRPEIADDAGRRVVISIGRLARYALELAWDGLRLPLLVVGHFRRARRLGAGGGALSPAAPAPGQPLYLRSDLVFGLQSGGSVGHIAGVVNSLERLGPSPVLVTTDAIPTVRKGIETHVVTPGRDFCGFEEAPALHFDRRLSRRVLELVGGRSVSFVYHRYAVSSLAGLELANALEVPFVLEYNGSEVWINRNWGRPLRYPRLARAVEDSLLRRADLVVVVSRPLADEARRRGVCERRLLLNPNGVDVDVYSPEVSGGPVRERLGLAAKRLLGFIGTFGRWHGAEVLAEAFGLLVARRPDWRDEVRLLMVGDGPTLPEAVRRLEAHGVRELAVLTGRLPQAEGPAHLAACNVLVSPHVPNPDGSPFFGSPTKLFEYMAMGKGIVASNLDQIGEVLDDGRSALLVTPGDAHELSRAIERLLADLPLAERLGQAARADAVAHHSWREHTRRILDALDGRREAEAVA